MLMLSPFSDQRDMKVICISYSLLEAELELEAYFFCDPFSGEFIYGTTFFNLISC